MSKKPLDPEEKRRRENFERLKKRWEPTPYEELFTPKELVWLKRRRKRLMALWHKESLERQRKIIQLARKSWMKRNSK